MTKLTFMAVRANQSPDHEVLTFAATAADVMKFAEIERVSRDDQGDLFGFQRPQIAAHIREIQDYLAKPDSILPNAVVVAFTDRVLVEDVGQGLAKITIDISKGVAGLVVDGQQRLTALTATRREDFQVFVAAMVCRDEAELRRQFVLINNTRPLPKSLIYELLPTVTGLPHRMQVRSTAAALTARLNYSDRSSLKGLIFQHTNPAGIIVDTAIQRVLMASLSDGVMRELIKEHNGERKCMLLASEFYQAVAHVFKDDWVAHKPRTSRLVHSAGIQAMGYVMEELASLDGARSWTEFAAGLGCLEGRVAWTGGSWNFGEGDVRPWNGVQNVNRDIIALTHFLTAIIRADIRKRHAAKTAPDARDALLQNADS